MKKLFLLLFVVIAILAGCGGSKPSTEQQLEQLSNQGPALNDQVALANATIEGGNLTQLTQKLIDDLRTASSNGLSDTWVNQQINDAEDTLSISGDCQTCYTMLEDNRP
jgi:hypothetical protein